MTRLAADRHLTPFNIIGQESSLLIWIAESWAKWHHSKDSFEFALQMPLRVASITLTRGDGASSMLVQVDAGFAECWCEYMISFLVGSSTNTWLPAEPGFPLSIVSDGLLKVAGAQVVTIIASVPGH